MHIKTHFLIGAGGHGKVVYEAMSSSELMRVIVWDDNVALKNKSFLDAIVQSPVDFNCLKAVGHVAIGNGRIRQQVSLRCLQAGKELVTVLHPHAVVSKFSVIEQGCFIAAGAIVAAGAHVGQGVIVNHGAIVDHDCMIGVYSHIAPNATLGGGVVIGERCLIGSGAVVLPGVSIVDDVTVGSGAVVISNIKKRGSIVCGVPANES